MSYQEDFQKYWENFDEVSCGKHSMQEIENSASYYAENENLFWKIYSPDGYSNLIVLFRMTEARNYYAVASLMLDEEGRLGISYIPKQEYLDLEHFIEEEA